MDRGVNKGYLERHFGGIDADLKWRKENLSDEAKRRFYGDKARFYEKQRKTVLEEFQMMQESRPMKPRGR